LQFRNVYALEKIHGTSAHIKWVPELDSDVRPDSKPGLSFFSGGEPHDKFVSLFDVPKLEQLFREKWDREVTIYGEAYGGKQQGMSKTYGDKLKFVVFDVKVGAHTWLDVPKAEHVALSLGLEFVDYVMVPTEITNDLASTEIWEEYGKLGALVQERNKPSTQAKRNGITEDKEREGIVLRPPFEVIRNNGKRVIAKFKNDSFSERKSKPSILDPAKQALIVDAQNVAFEFVTPMRLEHVLNRLVSERDDKSYSIKDTKDVIMLMIEDVEREGEGEFTTSQAVRKAIGGVTVNLFKKRLADDLRYSNG
jgi:hypothetical protein